MKIRDIIAEYRTPAEQPMDFLEALRRHIGGGWIHEKYRERTYRALAAGCRPQPAATVWRGMKLADIRPASDFRTRDAVRFEQWLSTSRRRETAVIFIENKIGYGHDGVLFRIATRAGAPGIHVPDYAADLLRSWDSAGELELSPEMSRRMCKHEQGVVAREQELILPPEAEFRVVAKQQLRASEITGIDRMDRDIWQVDLQQTA